MDKQFSLLLLLVAFCVLSACTTTTRVASRPSQADVVLNGKAELGQTPIEIRDMAWVWRTRKLQVHKEGYYTSFVDLDSNLRGSSVAACMCTLGLLFPVFFVGEYPASLVVDLEPVERAEAYDLSADVPFQFP